MSIYNLTRHFYYFTASHHNQYQTTSTCLYTGTITTLNVYNFFHSYNYSHYKSFIIVIIGLFCIGSTADASEKSESEIFSHADNHRQISIRKRFFYFKDEYASSSEESSKLDKIDLHSDENNASQFSQLGINDSNILKRSKRRGGGRGGGGRGRSNYRNYGRWGAAGMGANAVQRDRESEENFMPLIVVLLSLLFIAICYHFCSPIECSGICPQWCGKAYEGV